MRFLALAAAAGLAHAARPGDAPQCFEQHFCITTFAIGGQPWYYDLSGLCMPANSEYSVWKAGEPNPVSTTFPQIIFNVCGTVARDVAPFQPANVGANVTLPFPASHGVAIQLISDPTLDGQFTCADVDSCDQATNPTCAIGSLNYDATRNGNNPFIPTLPIAHDAARELQCSNNPSNVFCNVGSVPCTDNAAVLARYMGGEDTLGDTLDVRLADWNNPQGGINISYSNAPAFLSDPFVCHPIDPVTGNVAPRSVNIFIACDTNVPGLIADSYTEPQECAYFITARSAAACGTTVSPYVPSPSQTSSSTRTSSSTGSSTRTASRTSSSTPTKMPVAAAAPVSSPGTNFGYTLLGALVVAPAATLLFFAADKRGYFDGLKARLPAWAGGAGGAAAIASRGFVPIKSSAATASYSSSSGGYNAQ